MKRLPIALYTLFAASTANAAWITVNDTTCTASNSIVDLGNGVYPLYGLDRTHTFVVPGASNGNFFVPSGAQRLAVAICRQPPTPAADCFALVAEPGISVPFPIPPPETTNNLWIVVDTPDLTQPTNCGPYELRVFDNGD
jgi:hypothetical protein